MIRKWSYINFNKIPPLNHASLNITSRFQFKVFRKNTRFKKYNLEGTFFVRKLVMLRRRRLGWKYYITISSNWATNLLKYKKLINFLQTKLIFNYEVAYVNSKLFFKNSNQINFIGNGVHTLNYTFIKNKTHFVFFQKTFLKKKLNVRKNTIVRTAQFNQMSSMAKLMALGFSFTNITYNNILTVNNSSVFMFTNFYDLFKKYLIKTSILLALTLRRIHTYLVLLRINT